MITPSRPIKECFSLKAAELNQAVLIVFTAPKGSAPHTTPHMGSITLVMDASHLVWAFSRASAFVSGLTGTLTGTELCLLFIRESIGARESDLSGQSRKSLKSGGVLRSTWKKSGLWPESIKLNNCSVIR